MPLRRALEEAGVVINSEQLELLGRVFDQSSIAGENEHARETRASRILAYFLAGIEDEGELCELAKRPLRRTV
jgi:hypothetical protein